MRILLSILVLGPFIGHGQIGGDMAFQSLHVANNPRSAALGGTSISLADGDISQFFGNPATLDSVAAGDLFMHVNPYFSEATFFSMAYGFTIKKLENFAVGIHYLGFGDFEMTDPTGASLGSFSASDFTIYLSKSQRMGPFVLGSTFKFLNSAIESYTSTMVALDLGGIFSINPYWTLGMSFRNMGFRLTNPSELSQGPMPFEVRIGTSVKPRYMPVRFTLTSNSLLAENILSEEENAGRNNELLERLFRKVNFGAEILISDHFQLLLGYNHKRKQELRLEETAEGAGFSYGLMLNVKRFELRFSRATYHAAAGSSFISLKCNLREIRSIL